MAGAVNEEKYWRALAADAREQAGRMKDATSRAILLRIAEAYDSLAERAREKPEQK